MVKPRGTLLEDRSLTAEWDFGRENIFFVTLCARGKVHVFGNVRQGVFQPSLIGQIATACWLEIQDKFPYILLDEFCVLPDQNQGILFFDITAYSEEPQIDFRITRHPHSVSIALADFKISVSRKARLIQPEFNWKPGYYKYMIRSEDDLERVREYIRSNPARWIEGMSPERFPWYCG